MSLPRVQAIVGVAAGIASIVAAVVSIPSFVKPAPSAGDVVAVVHEAKSGKAITDATIEILTSQDALVTTLTADGTGRARHTLQHGLYRVRVSHPRFTAETRQIQVFPGQTSEVRWRLRPGSSSPLQHAERAVKEGVGSVRRFFGF